MEGKLSGDEISIAKNTTAIGEHTIKLTAFGLAIGELEAANIVALGVSGDASVRIKALETKIEN